jgi:hypothetical protein
MLTKWTFAFFLAVPVLWVARRNIKNALIAVAVAALISSYWYIPAATRLDDFFRLNTAGGISEGDPTRWSVQAIVFYVRALAGYQLFFPLFVAFVAGVIKLGKSFDSRWIPIVLYIVGGWLGLMLLQNKDPRYSAPLLSGIALITVTAFERRRILTAVLLCFLVVQHYMVSFGFDRIPERLVLVKGVEGPLSWDWNLYLQNYFNLWGRPAREDWKIQHVLDQVAATATDRAILGIVPDIPRFDWLAFEFYIAAGRTPVAMNRVQSPDERSILANDFILVSEKSQGWTTDPQATNQVNTYIISHPDRFQALERFVLPNGEAIRLYKVQ